jgi:D-arabinose 1-dehydrogenase-like Zn-dependent alcohol dehydrogenase
MSSESIIASILKLSTKEGHAGVEGVIVAAGGSIEPFSMGLGILRPLGVLMLLGNPSPETHLSVDVPKALVKNIKIISTLMSGTKDCEEALNYLAMGQIHPKLMIRSFMDVDQVLKDIKAGLTMGKVVLPIG